MTEEDTDELHDLEKLESEVIDGSGFAGLRTSIADGSIEGEGYRVCVGTGGMTVELMDRDPTERVKFPLDQFVQHAYMRLTEENNE